MSSGRRNGSSGRVTAGAQATAPLCAYGRRARRLPFVLAAVVAAAACGVRVPPPLTLVAGVEARPGVEAQPEVAGRRGVEFLPDRVRQLQVELARLLEAPVLARAHVGFVVASVTRGDVLFQLNDQRLLMPASNMKLLTLAVAAERLGWDFTFETTLHATGPIVQGVLEGDLVVVGSGDPSISTRDDAATRGTFELWADVLRTRGIRRIAGRIVGDDRAFADEAYGAGWAWDTLPYGYAAPIGALQVNENTLRLTLAPGRSAGARASVTIEDEGADVTVRHEVVTGPAGSPVNLAARRLPGRLELRLGGSVPLRSDPVRRTFSVENPTLYFVEVLASTLGQHGVEVEGGVADIDALRAGVPEPLPQPLLVHRSPPLRDLARVLMKSSQNLYAETLLRALGRAPGVPAAGESGRAVLGETLAAWGIPPDAVVIADASGLSRYNYVTPAAVLAVLRRMQGTPADADPWVEALAIGGVDGTLERRFRRSPAQGRVRAKTGSISNVRSLSGYVDTAGGERLAFVILLNATTAPARELDTVIDAVVERLAAFER
jgi:serine-type D-Ala-D-Ala carboxypeptidase/endopeptidase (penicillin-binding protein 4)